MKKKIKLFLCGDYAFFTSMYGLSGSSDTFPCLWYLIKRYTLDTPQAKRNNEYRTLKQIKEDVLKFHSQGHGKKRKASQFNNVIH